MKIVELNLWHGGGRRLQMIADWLEAQKADLLVLSEWRANQGGRDLADRLATSGYSINAQARDRLSNGLFIASRSPVATKTLTPEGADKGELILAELPCALTLIGAYFPQSYAQIPFIEACHNAAVATSWPLVIVGDLNTGCNTWDREAGGAPFHCAAQFTSLTSRSGLTDLWRHRHGGEAREWTWRSRRNGFRIDHALGNTALLERYRGLRCQYDHVPREQGLSDHSALVVTLHP